jgi:hypothetical protein
MSFTGKTEFNKRFVKIKTRRELVMVGCSLQTYLGIARCQLIGTSWIFVSENPSVARQRPHWGTRCWSVAGIRCLQGNVRYRCACKLALISAATASGFIN